MEELALLLAEFAEDELFTEVMLVMSAEEELLAEMAFDSEMLGAVRGIVETYDSFKAWSAATLPSISQVLNGLVLLQMIYHMIGEHFRLVSDSGRTIDVEAALQDVEGTLKRNFNDLQDTARKLLQGNISSEARKVLENTLSLSPQAYWTAARVPIMQALMKMPMYSV